MIIEITTFLFDKKLEELVGTAEETEVKVSLDTHRIESVRERIADEETDICKKTCIVMLKSGDSYQVGKSYTEMVNIWKNNPTT